MTQWTVRPEMIWWRSTADFESPRNDSAASPDAWRGRVGTTWWTRSCSQSPEEPTDERVKPSHNTITDSLMQTNTMNLKLTAMTCMGFTSWKERKQICCVIVVGWWWRITFTEMFVDIYRTSSETVQSTLSRESRLKKRERTNVRHRQEHRGI